MLSRLSTLPALLLALLLAPLNRAADPRVLLHQAITTNEAKAQIVLVQKLADSPEPIVKQVLTGWRQGAVFLFEVPDQTQVPFLLDAASDAAGKAKGFRISDGAPIKDETGQPILFLASDLTAADTTSKLRKAIKTTLDVLSLADPNPNVRRDAAIKLALEQNPEYLPYFEGRLKSESHREVERALAEAVAITQLASEEAAKKQAAIVELGNLRSISSLELLQKMHSESKTNSKAFGPEMVRALQSSIAQVEHHIFWGNLFGTFFRGLSLSAVLLIAAIGLAITFGLMGIINQAHGEMIMIGAYTAYVTQNVFIKWFGQGTRGFDFYFIAALPAAFVTCGLVGLVLERSIIRFLYKRPLESLLATWGISLILQQVMRAIFGAANVQVYSPSWLSGNFVLQDIIFAFNRVFVIGFALAIVLFTWLLLTKTSLGLQVRALMQNRQMAACIGVRSDRVNMATFGFGCGLAGLAGACLSQIGNIGPNLGQSHIVDCFMVVVLGGVGNLGGTISAALGIGVTDQILQPHFGAVMGKIIVLAGIILFLQWRPAGLFANRSRSLEG